MAIEAPRAKLDMINIALAGLLVKGLTESEKIQQLLDSLPDEVPPELAEEAAWLKSEFQNIRYVETELNVLVEEALLLDPNDTVAVASFVNRWKNSGLAPRNKGKAIQ